MADNRISDLGFWISDLKAYKKHLKDSKLLSFFMN